MSNLLLLKLGGSLLTDKAGVEALRPAVLGRLAQEVQAARREDPDLQLVVGHGSGSFGHVAAARHGTARGAHTPEEWRGFADVSAAAARLNRLVTEALLAAGVPALSLQPSASALCEDGTLIQLAVEPVRMALQRNLVPVVYGDVAFDRHRGGTIISTEKILSFLVKHLRPSWLLLAGETEGVYDAEGQVAAAITPETFPALEAALGASRGTDVTGGMDSKVRGMLELVRTHPALRVSVFSGLEPGRLQQALLQPGQVTGTIIRCQDL
ncbi:MAG TPA: isopentenyl phosphate kinase [Candidatus Sulfomarinibacteraceae bacterium]|nr:isopentenyl phosphate kinase [Candidatus Sulfomarinibacteraceae bacterium]